MRFRYFIQTFRPPEHSPANSPRHPSELIHSENPFDSSTRSERCLSKAKFRATTDSWEKLKVQHAFRVAFRKYGIREWHIRPEAIARMDRAFPSVPRTVSYNSSWQSPSFQDSLTRLKRVLVAFSWTRLSSDGRKRRKLERRVSPFAECASDALELRCV